MNVNAIAVCGHIGHTDPIFREHSVALTSQTQTAPPQDLADRLGLILSGLLSLSIVAVP